MRKPIYSFLLLLFISFSSKAALYQTPGTGVNWTLSDLVANSGGNLSFSGTEYHMTDLITINTNDTLQITTDEVIRFSPTVLFTVKGVLLIAPPNNVLFTALDPTTGYVGLRLEFSDSSKISRLTYEYANALVIADCSPRILNSTFRYNGQNLSGTEGAINLFRSKPRIENSTFFENRRAAIQSGASVASSPQILGCTFLQNNTSNSNRPQINLGTTGVDTARILGCQIIGGNINSGGIGFLPIGTVFAIIKHNYIKNNRYGIVFNGGNNINSLISYNQIEDNNIENNPLNGGSGINFLGGSATSHQNSVVTGNIIARNLWGITIQTRAQPNLGNLNNADTSDDGKNKFINNTNASTPGIDLYNNTVDPIFAMGNDWNTNVPGEIEGKIFHQVDNPALGLVDYGNFVVPVTLISFSASRANADVNLSWQTAQEANSDYFTIERSYDGNNFVALGQVDAAGNSSTVLQYNYTDVNANPYGGNVYYRLKMVDLDGTSVYSEIKLLSFEVIKETFVNRFGPTQLSASQSIAIEIAAHKTQQIQLQIVDALGRVYQTQKVTLQQGFNRIPVNMPATLQKGAFFIRMRGERFEQTIRLLVK